MYVSTHSIVQVTSEELVERQRVRESLESSAVTLKTQVAGPNASRLDERLSQVAELWERLGREIESRREGKTAEINLCACLTLYTLSLDRTQSVLDPLISRVESLGSRFTDFDTWLTEQEKSLDECGPIGAHLQRLEEQAEILEVSHINSMWTCILSSYILRLQYMYVYRTISANRLIDSSCKMVLYLRRSVFLKI